MNTENTCCQTGEAASAVAETNETEVNFTEPTWTADRHDKGVSLELTLPGVKKKNLKLEVHGQQLRLEARRATAESPGRLIYGRPRPEGYRLKLRLGDKLDGDAMEAKLADGILTLEIPLVESARPRKVEVN